MILDLLFFLWVWTRCMLLHDVEGHQHCTFLRSPEASLLTAVYAPVFSDALCSCLHWDLCRFIKGLNQSWLKEIKMWAFSFISLQITVNENWNIGERTTANRGPKFLKTFWSEHHVGCKRRKSNLLDVDQAYESGVKVPRGAKICVYTGTERQAHWSFKMEK